MDDSISWKKEKKGDGYFYTAKLNGNWFEIIAPIDLIDPRFHEFKFFVNGNFTDRNNGEFDVMFFEEFGTFQDAEKFCVEVAAEPFKNAEVKAAEAASVEDVEVIK